MITDKGLDLVFDALKNHDSRRFDLGGCGHLTLALGECPSLWRLGVNFSGHINLGAGGIKLQDPVENAMTLAIIRAITTELERAKNNETARDPNVICPVEEIQEK